MRWWGRFAEIGALGLMIASGLTACGGIEGQGDAGVTADQGGGGDQGVSHAAFASLYSAYLQNCANCHAPGAPGRTDDIEKSLNFSTVDTAYQSLKYLRATGLVGNQAACNGIPFIGPTYQESLLAAVLDENVRQNFQFGSCGSDNVSDMVAKVGFEPPPGFLNDLKAWIDSGAP